MQDPLETLPQTGRFFLFVLLPDGTTPPAIARPKSVEEALATARAIWNYHSIERFPALRILFPLLGYTPEAGTAYMIDLFPRRRWRGWCEAVVHLSTRPARADREACPICGRYSGGGTHSRCSDIAQAEIRDLHRPL